MKELWPLIVEDTRALFEVCAKAAPESGLVAEFGVRDGGSLRHILELFGPTVYGFDSFEGLPSEWRKSASASAPAGWFKADPPEIDGAEIIAGLFADTAGPFFDRMRQPVRFLHIDGDLYESAVDVLTAAGPWLVPGSVIQFDELCKFELSNYEYWREGEWKALEESGLKWEPVARTRHEQAAVRIV